MKFGKVDHPERIDFTIPPDHLDTPVVLSKNKTGAETKVFVGCAKWNRQELKNFYPRGTKDELAYNSTALNSTRHSTVFFLQNNIKSGGTKHPKVLSFFQK